MGTLISEIEMDEDCGYQADLIGDVEEEPPSSIDPERWRDAIFPAVMFQRSRKGGKFIAFHSPEALQ